MLRVRCPGPPGSCSPVCTLCVLCCVYGVLGLLAPVHRCGRSVCGAEAVPRTPWLGYGIQPVFGPLTPCTEGKTPVDARCEPGGSVFRAVMPRIGNRCTASTNFPIRISGINRVLFSHCFRQFLRFRSDNQCFDCWRLGRDFSVTASLTVIYRYLAQIVTKTLKSSGIALMHPQFSHSTLGTLIRIFQDVEIGFSTSTSPHLI